MWSKTFEREKKVSVYGYTSCLAGKVPAIKIRPLKDFLKYQL
jgi:hypothetical protein